MVNRIDEGAPLDPSVTPGAHYFTQPSSWYDSSGLGMSSKGSNIDFFST